MWGGQRNLCSFKFLAPYIWRCKFTISLCRSEIPSVAILDWVKLSSLELLTEQLGMKSLYSKWSELSSFSLWNSFLGCFSTEISGVSSCNDSSEALSSVSLVLDSLEVSVLSAGGLGLIAGFLLRVFKSCKIEGDSDWSVFNGSWFSISPLGGLVVFVASAFSCN